MPWDLIENSNLTLWPWPQVQLNNFMETLRSQLYSSFSCIGVILCVQCTLRWNSPSYLRLNSNVARCCWFVLLLPSFKKICWSTWFPPFGGLAGTVAHPMGCPMVPRLCFQAQAQKKKHCNKSWRRPQLRDQTACFFAWDSLKGSHLENMGSWKAGSPSSNPLLLKAQSRQWFIGLQQSHVTTESAISCNPNLGYHNSIFCMHDASICRAVGACCCSQGPQAFW